MLNTMTDRSVRRTVIVAFVSLFAAYAFVLMFLSSRSDEELPLTSPAAAVVPRQPNSEVDQVASPAVPGLSGMGTEQVETQGAAGLFVGLTPFLSHRIEKLSDPSDVLSPFSNVSASDVDPDGVGYRYFIVRGRDPDILYEDVCPAGYEATWYSFSATGGDRINIYFESEVEPASGDRAAWFGPVSSEGVGGQPPIHIAFCSYSNTRGDFRRSHSIFTTNDGAVNVGSPRTVRCMILVNNSGSRTVIDEASGQETAFCGGDR
jgi:hypothetical protein